MKKITSLLICILFSYSALAKETLALNIALSLPKVLTDRVQTINKKIKTDNSNSFEFDSTHLPHITLMQFFLEKDKLSAFLNKIAQFKNEGISLEMKDVDTSVVNKDPSTKLLNLIFRKNDEVTKLHEKIKQEFGSFFVADGNQESFFMNEPVDEQFIEYVKTFEKEESGDNYSPHITLGIIKSLDKDEVWFKAGEKFNFNELMVVQIGNYGTARKVLKKVNLNSKK